MAAAITTHFINGGEIGPAGIDGRADIDQRQRRLAFLSTRVIDRGGIDTADIDGRVEADP